MDEDRKRQFVNEVRYAMGFDKLIIIGLRKTGPNSTDSRSFYVDMSDYEYISTLEIEKHRMIRNMMTPPPNLTPVMPIGGSNE